MRLSRWRTGAPVRDALGPKASAAIEPVITALGADPDPHAWVQWGEDPAIRYAVLVPTAAGLIVCNVRHGAPGEGPRASGKLVRWSRVQLGELAVETHGGRRLASFQVETLVLRGVDAEADAVAAFALTVLAGAEGRPIPEPRDTRPRRSTKAPTATGRPGRPPAGAARRPVERERGSAGPPAAAGAAAAPSRRGGTARRAAGA